MNDIEAVLWIETLNWQPHLTSTGDDGSSPPIEQH